MKHKIKIAQKDMESTVWKVEEFSWTFVKNMPMKCFSYNASKLKELADSRLSTLEKAIFFFMMYNRFEYTTACLLSKSGTAKKLGISYNTANKGLEGLVKAKVLGKINGYIYDNKICQFYINDYEQWELPNAKTEHSVNLEFMDTLIQ